MQNNTKACLLIGVAWVCLGAAGAQACPEKHYKEKLTGWCVRGGGGDVGRFFEKAKDNLRSEGLGPALALWLEQSRDSARGAAQPIPENIRAKLEGFVPDPILDKVRYKSGDRGVFNLGGFITREDHAHAVTLIDTIIFDRAWDAENDAQLWAHELYHVMQFDKGTLDFAKKYARNYGSVEEAAYSFDSKYASWAASEGIELTARADGTIRLNGGIVLLGDGYFIQSRGYEHIGPSPHRHKFAFYVHGPEGVLLKEVSFIGDNDRDWRAQTNSFVAGDKVVRFAFSDWNDNRAIFRYLVEEPVPVAQVTEAQAPSFQSTRVTLHGGTVALGSGYEVRGMRHGHRGPSDDDHWFEFSVHGPDGGVVSTVRYEAHNKTPWKPRTKDVALGDRTLAFAFAEWNDGAADFHYAWK